MREKTYKLREIRRGCIFQYNNIIFVKTGTTQLSNDSYTNVINQWGRATEIDELADVEVKGHLEEYFYLTPQSS